MRLKTYTASGIWKDGRVIRCLNVGYVIVYILYTMTNIKVVSVFAGRHNGKIVATEKTRHLLLYKRMSQL